MKKMLLSLLIVTSILLSIAGCTPETTSVSGEENKAQIPASQATEIENKQIIGEEKQEIVSESLKSTETVEKGDQDKETFSKKETVSNIKTESSKPVTVKKEENNLSKPAENKVDKKENTESKISENIKPKPKVEKKDENISKTKAKEIALKHAGVKKEDIFDFEAELDREKGVLVWEIGFETKSDEYDYHINALTKKIEFSKKEDKIPKGNIVPKESTVSKENNVSKESNISREKAKEIALKHAGVKEEDIFDFEAELDREKGVFVWEIGFETKSDEYDYHINALTKKIEFSKKEDKIPKENAISKEEAKDIIFKRAGVKETEVLRFEINLDYDDDSKIQEYEFQLDAGNMEYEGKLNAADGSFIEFEKEEKDD